MPPATQRHTGIRSLHAQPQSWQDRARPPQQPRANIWHTGTDQFQLHSQLRLTLFRLRSCTHLALPDFVQDLCHCHACCRVHPVMLAVNKGHRHLRRQIRIHSQVCDPHLEIKHMLLSAVASQMPQGWQVARINSCVQHAGLNPAAPQKHTYLQLLQPLLQGRVRPCPRCQ